MRTAVFPVVGRLRFAGDLEPSFTRHRVEQSLPFARFALVLALLLYALFGILDFYIVPVGARWIWVIRYVIFCPVALAVFDMADRLGALGGSLQVESAPQRGTTVSGAIPAGAGADAG